MKAVWEQRRKPHIEYLMSTKNGHYMALESVCHSCEHAYKVIKKGAFGEEVSGDVMQFALEAILRVHDFTKSALRGDSYKVDEKPFWGRRLAREIREFLLNPLKHNGALPKWIEFTNNPKFVGISTTTGHGRNISPEVEFDPNQWELGVTEDGKPFWYKEKTEPILWSDPEVKVKYGAKSVILLLSQGLDNSYDIFTDPKSSESQKSWFSSAKEGQYRGDIHKQRKLISNEMKAHWN